MKDFNSLKKQVTDYIKAQDWLVITVRLFAIAFIVGVYKVFMSFEIMLKEYYFLGDDTIKYIFGMIFIILLIWDTKLNSKDTK